MAMDDSDPQNEPGFDLGHVPQPTAAVAARQAQASGESYRVLARAYRPQTFAELIGQDAMVQTLGNAIKRNRLAHAFLMTGVRGVGKTSTARLIAKALNCIGPDGDGGPTIDPCGVCSHCTAIAEGRHIDVQEMDAASNTGIDDVREIIDSVRYASVSARYKIYIIDEVHMLSKQAFNGLLKTLEEPPPHVKFLFATTEVQKVPVTVLSRCQRFDLRRITPDLLTQHFTEILGKEAVQAEEAAVRMIASAAEGSVRDGLSLLDQAIAHAGQDNDSVAIITAANVQDMLGLSDRGATRQLYAALLTGDSGALIDQVRGQYALGAEPLTLIRGAMELTHAITLAKLARDADPTLSEGDKAAVQDWSLKLGHGTLHRLWQLLIKGHQEVIEAPRALEACEMALLRVMYAVQMPDPSEIVTLLQAGGAVAAPPAPSAAVAPSAVSHPEPDRIEAVHSHNVYAEMQQAEVQHAESTLVPDDSRSTDHGLHDLAAVHLALEGAGQHQMARLLHDHVRLLHIGLDTLDYAQTDKLTPAFAQDLAQALRSITGKRWFVRAVEQPEAALPTPSLQDQILADKAAADAAIAIDPLVAAALKAFPDAHILPDTQGSSQNYH